MKKPIRKKTIDIMKLIVICQKYIDFVDSDDYCEDNDYEYYIFQAALETIYGNDCWDFINSKLKD